MPWGNGRDRGDARRSAGMMGRGRRGGTPRWLAWWVAAGSVVAVGQPLAAQETPGSSLPSATAGEPRVGYTPADATAELSEELKAIAIPSPAQSDSFSHTLSYEPHMAGTPAQARTRDFVISTLQEVGPGNRSPRIRRLHAAAQGDPRLALRRAWGFLGALPPGGSDPGRSDIECVPPSTDLQRL